MINKTNLSAKNRYLFFWHATWLVMSTLSGLFPFAFYRFAYFKGIGSEQKSVLNSFYFAVAIFVLSTLFPISVITVLIYLLFYKLILFLISHLYRIEIVISVILLLFASALLYIFWGYQTENMGAIFRSCRDFVLYPTEDHFAQLQYMSRSLLSLYRELQAFQFEELVKLMELKGSQQPWVVYFLSFFKNQEHAQLMIQVGDFFDGSPIRRLEIFFEHINFQLSIVSFLYLLVLSVIHIIYGLYQGSFERLKLEFILKEPHFSMIHPLVRDRLQNLKGRPFKKFKIRSIESAQNEDFWRSLTLSLPEAWSSQYCLGFHLNIANTDAKEIKDLSAFFNWIRYIAHYMIFVWPSFLAGLIWYTPTIWWKLTWFVLLVLAGLSYAILGFEVLMKQRKIDFDLVMISFFMIAFLQPFGSTIIQAFFCMVLIVVGLIQFQIDRRN